MAEQFIKPIGYLTYKLKLKDGGGGLPVKITVGSLEEADRIRQLKLEKQHDEIEHVDFKVVSLNNRKVIWDYSRPTEKQLRTLPSNKKKIEPKARKGKGLSGI